MGDCLLCSLLVTVSVHLWAVTWVPVTCCFRGALNLGISALYLSCGQKGLNYVYGSGSCEYLSDDFDVNLC